VLAEGLPERSFLNVNVPPGPPEGVRVSVQWQPGHGAAPFEVPGGREKASYWADEDRHRWESDTPSDRGVVSSGRISMTLIQTDCTNHRLTKRLQGWARDLDGEAEEEQPKAAGAEER
jgi:5'-nucleotidase